MFTHVLRIGRRASIGLRNNIKIISGNGFIDGLSSGSRHVPCASFTSAREMSSTDANTPNLIQQEKENLIGQVGFNHIHENMMRIRD